MKILTAHQDGHALNDRLKVLALDEPGPGGAHHEYEVRYMDGPLGRLCGIISFQCGPRDKPGSRPGLTEGALLAILIDRIEDFQAGEFACDENAHALAGLRAALAWTKQRADARANRGVLGTMKV